MFEALDKLIEKAGGKEMDTDKVIMLSVTLVALAVLLKKEV